MIIMDFLGRKWRFKSKFIKKDAWQIKDDSILMNVEIGHNKRSMQNQHHLW